MGERGTKEKSLDPVSGFDYRVAQFQSQAAFRFHIVGWHAQACGCQGRVGNDVRVAASMRGSPWMWPAES
jgi:hypothetical protein